MLLTNGDCQVARKAGMADGEIELRAPEEETRGVELKNSSAEELGSGTTVVRRW